MAQASKEEPQTEQYFGDLVYSSLMKLTGRGKEGTGQGNYRPADESRQGGLYLPIREMEQHGVPRMVRVTVTLLNDSEVSSYADEQRAALEKTLAGLTGGGNHNGNGSGSGRA